MYGKGEKSASRPVVKGRVSVNAPAAETTLTLLLLQAERSSGGGYIHLQLLTTDLRCL